MKTIFFHSKIIFRQLMITASSWSKLASSTSSAPPQVHQDGGNPLNIVSLHCLTFLYYYLLIPPALLISDELIVSGIYRMPRYRTFSYIEEYIVSNLPYRVSRYALDMPLFCLFPPKILRKIRKFSGNSENSPEILRKFRKFAEISENSPKILKIRRKFIKKKVFL